MSQDAFKKFINVKKNSVVKENFKQDKRKARLEKRAYFEAKKKAEYEERQAKRMGQTIPQPTQENKVSKKPAAAKVTNTVTTTEVMPLNKFLAHCGVCSRRDAVSLVSNKLVKVNNKICEEPGYKVQPTDKVEYNGKQLFVTKNLVYILLNKPKDYLTTTDDPEGRKTVLDLVKAATAERVYPIGRLDRNTSGVLLLTNDGELTQKLSHPSYRITKIYEAKLDKPLTQKDFDKILAGLVLEDGKIQVDALAYADIKDKSVIGIEIHSGRNRIVRRIFEHLGYDVKALDRVSYAGLTKKNVERSKWRYLAEKEIRALKYLNNKDAAGSTKAEQKLKPKKASAQFSDKELADAVGEKEGMMQRKPVKVKKITKPEVVVDETAPIKIKGKTWQPKAKAAAAPRKEATEKKFADKAKKSFGKPATDKTTYDKKFADKTKKSFTKPTAGKVTTDKKFGDKTKKSFGKPTTGKPTFSKVTTDKKFTERKPTKKFGK
jgi:23S rRNA pseudouridine2605 synthase